jgi:hypothetical protein
MSAESPLVRLHRFGQSPWLDFLSRPLIQCGNLQHLISECGVRGVTSNPAIFEKAISTGTSYAPRSRPSPPQATTPPRSTRP